MIKKLRNKFIAVNMLLVGIVLIFVFLSVYISAYRNYYNESLNILKMALELGDSFYIPQHEIGRPKDNDKKVFNSTAFLVQVDKDGNITDFLSYNLSVGTDVLNEIVDTALNGNDSTGVIREYSLRYLKQTYADGTTAIAFNQIDNEISALESLLVNSLLIGLGSFVILFMISWLLANLAIKPVEKSWNQQRQFVADASHELKTPLTVILANTDILLSHKKETISKQSKWVENTKTEAERMTTLVNDLLFLAKADAEKKDKIGFSKFCLSETVTDTVLSFESVAFEKGLTLNSTINPQLFINGDGQK